MKVSEMITSKFLRKEDVEEDITVTIKELKQDRDGRDGTPDKPGPFKVPRLPGRLQLHPPGAHFLHKLRRQLLVARGKLRRRRLPLLLTWTVSVPLSKSRSRHSRRSSSPARRPVAMLVTTAAYIHGPAFSAASSRASSS